MIVTRGSMVIVTGPPGAGKTTVAKIVADGSDKCVLLVGDDFHHYIRRGGLAPWRREAAQQNEVVIDATAAAATSYALGGYLVVVDGIIGPWYVDRWLAHVPDELPVHYVVLRPNAEIALRRAAERTGRTDLVDPEPVALMHRAFTERGGLEGHVLDNSRLTVEETAASVLRLVSEGGCLLTRC